MLAALQAWDPVVGLVVGSLWAPTTLPGLSAEGLHALAREVAVRSVPYFQLRTSIFLTASFHSTPLSF